MDEFFGKMAERNEQRRVAIDRLAQKRAAMLGARTAEEAAAALANSVRARRAAIKDLLREHRAWEKAQRAPGYPDDFRLDSFGALMRRSEYGQTSDFGWEIDHTLPRALITDRPGLRPLLESPANEEAMHWRNNRRKGARLG